MPKIYFETIGQGPEIVLLHGWGIHSGIWQSVATILAERFRVTLIDLPGFGRSEMIKHYSIDNVVNHLLTIAPAKATWIGWSLGGLVATRLALMHPQCIEKLICVASSPKFLKSIDWPGISITMLQKFNQQLLIDYEATLMRFILLQFYGVTLNKEMINWLRFNLFLHGKPNIDALNAGLNLLETIDLREQLSASKCPIFYILGKMDALVPSGIVQSLDGVKNIHSVIIPNAGHALFLSHEQEFINHVRSFLNE